MFIIKLFIRRKIIHPMKQLSFLSLMIMLTIASACSRNANVIPDTAKVTAVPPSAYAKMYTAKMKGIRNWTCYNYSYGNWNNPPGGTKYDTTQLSAEITIINDTTLFFRGDTLKFMPEQTYGFGGNIYKTDTTEKLLYSADEVFRNERILFYYYKKDSITSHTSYTANGGGYSTDCHTN